ncbi:hypothetical protein LR48_Vigan08g062600 [Vigna angularis]|uniref:Putative plant transposon protein domain-containing protein n=1 Tax=Phaseolus angularis TaxID=3914 RepID=A0A0L9V512_PHAAN|nr:hypothetical protein LR48_Vigan08g062600 [Vigna angularis]
MTSSSGKRIQTLGSKRKELDNPYSTKFLSHRHEQHFISVQDRRLLMERKAGWIPDFAPQFGEQLENKNWEKIDTYPAPANIAVVKEFYTNARRLGDYPTEDYMSYVRGKIIRYDPDSINMFLNIEWAGEQCQFDLNMEEGEDFDDVESVLCVPRGNFQRNRNDVVVHIKRADLTPLAKGMSINIGQVIANEIQVCANTMTNKASLGHPSLITHLCELAGVNISTLPVERPRKAIDEAYYRQYCGGDEAAQPLPPRQSSRRRGPPQAHAPPHDAEPFQMRDMYMSLMEDRLQSIHRGQVATEEMIIGIGAGAAEAPAMDDDEKYDDDFEDAEKEGEEEDSDDSMG